jgi:RNA polymerase sigma-70 factor (ECF subfamily)
VEANPIVERLATGPVDFDAAFLGSYSRLVRTLTVICGDAEVAADCVADAFERAFVRWRRIARLDDPVAWVRRVAINRAHDVHRRSTRGIRAVERLAATAAAQPAEQAEPHSFRPDDQIMDAITALPQQQRTVVVLHYLEDMSVIDVATTMGLTDGAVKYHLHQARERLRAHLDTPGEGTS